MLRITIDLVPHGNEKCKKTLATLDIINTGHKIDEAFYKYIYRAKGIEMDSNQFSIEGSTNVLRHNNPLQFLYFILKGIYK